MAETEQALRREVDPWEVAIAEWARGYKDTTTVAEVLTSALKIVPEKQVPAMSRRVGSCMRALGWSSKIERYDGKPQLVFRAG